jgi:hypothetical protein
MFTKNVAVTDLGDLYLGFSRGVIDNPSSSLIMIPSEFTTTDLKLDNTQELMLIHDMQTIVIDRSPIEIDVQSSSRLSGFKLDEASKRISFTVDGDVGTPGRTIVPIAIVLKGPYTVTIDGEMTEDFELGTDDSGQQTMTINYTHSTHEITITGAEVVPEFPIVSLAAITASIGAIAILGRIGFLRKF